MWLNVNMTFEGGHWEANVKIDFLNIDIVKIDFLKEGSWVRQKTASVEVYQNTVKTLEKHIFNVKS